ncbi:MAG: alkaline phosphatase family protein [Deltaproteobacteria bacterium]|nr:alkaline phosphatase family protein [Deltaproteobacteria bacterium]
MTENRKRVLVIGLDGFTWDLGRGFMAEGIMPNLARLVQDGCHGTLESVVPYETGPAWSSFQTGCYPVKTGVFAFHGYSSETRQIKLNSFSEINVPTLWELLSSEGKKIVSINMPVTSPPPKINGVIVPGMTCPKLSRQTVHPPEIYEKYIKPDPNYLIVNNQRQDGLQDYIRELSKTESHRCNLALQLMQEIDWDLFAVQIQNTDTFQHHNWWALDPSAAGFTKESYLQATEFYKEIDAILGKLIQAAGESVLTAVVSDHGFCSQKAEIGINTWLIQHGYLHMNEDEKRSRFKRLKNKVKEAVPPLKYLASVYGKFIKSLSSWAVFINKDHVRNSRSILYSEKVAKHLRANIDLDRSLAFGLGGMGEVLYIIDKTQADKANEMIKKLLKAYGPDSSEPLIATIRPIEAPCENNKPPHFLPDYIITLMDGVEARVNPKGASVVESGIINGKQRGTHAQDGIFVLQGPGVKKTNFNASIVDIAPTILSYFSIPVPDYIDGMTLSEAFAETLDIQYRTVEIPEKRDTQYSDIDQSIVEKQLEDLGYL